jgi:hypothetical protein
MFLYQQHHHWEQCTKSSENLRKPVKVDILSFEFIHEFCHITELRTEVKQLQEI